VDGGWVVGWRGREKEGMMMGEEEGEHFWEEAS
jgi:hypothetical protein